ncbi:MAG: AcrR family transcriptional regulator [Kiritimatiellia bacterium]|jgi:AcrR family transcriptional regulator
MDPRMTSKRRRLDVRQVIEAAIAVVEAEGAAALGVNRVARALGIKPPSLYNHVANGDALVSLVVIEGNRRLLAAMRVVDTCNCAEDRLLALAVATRAWALDNAGLYTVMAQTPAANDHPDFIPLLQQMLALFGDPLTAMSVAPSDVVHAIRALRAAVHGFVLLEISGQFGLPSDIEGSFEWLVRSMLRGMAEIVGLHAGQR